jgi:hypothetical protein
MLNQSNLIALAKQGNPHAIATLINRSLQPQGIRAKTTIKADCLRVMLESQQVPDQQSLVKLIKQGLTKLKIESIKTVKIYGKQVEQDLPIWRYQFNLINPDKPIYSSKDSGEEACIIQPLKDTTVNQKTEQESSETAQSHLKNSQKAVTPTKQEVFKQILKALGSYQVWNRVLLILISLRLAFDILFVFYSLTWASSYYFLDLIDAVDPTKFLARAFSLLFTAIDSLGEPLKLAKGWLYLFTGIVTLVWLHRLHAQLKVLFKNYPVTPWGAIARYIIPFYSFWGIWNLFSTLAQKLKSQTGDLVRYGSSLKRWLPWLYISLIASALLQGFYMSQSRSMYKTVIYVAVFVMNNVMNLVLTLVWLQIVFLITKAIVHKTKKVTRT